MITGRHEHPGRRHHGVLLSLVVLTAVAGLAGGLLLVVGPDGHLLGMTPTLLSGTPFDDWLVPGLALGGLVGGGFSVTALVLRQIGRAHV